MTVFAQLGPPIPTPRDSNDLRSRELRRQHPKWDKWYDPPEGWRYGFPKLYQPRHQRENLAETLVRDGYPRKLAKKAAKHCRFWFTKADEPETKVPLIIERDSNE